jgi:hypothetical protein
MPDTTRDQQIETWTETLRAQHTRIETLIHSLSAQQFHHRSQPKTWSIAQQLDHLRSSNSKIAPKILAAAEAAGAAPPNASPWRPSLFERQFLRMVSDNPPVPVPVPPMYLPADQPDPEAILSGCWQSLQSFEETLRIARSADILRIKITSPAAKWMRLTIGCWIQGTTIHNNYHLGCAERLAAALREK